MKNAIFLEDVAEFLKSMKKLVRRCSNRCELSLEGSEPFPLVAKT